MYDAPSVSYPVGRCVWPGVLLLALWLAGAMATAAWGLQSAHQHPALAGALALPVLCAVAGWGAWRRWREAGADMLCFERGQWLVLEGSPASASARPVAAPVVALDFQALMLLRLQGEGGAALAVLRGGAGGRWLWLSRRAAPGHWLALRRAVYSRARRAGVDAAARTPVTAPEGPRPS